MGNLGKGRQADCIGGAFLEGTALCRCQVRKASFFLPETRFFGDAAAANGKRIRREKFCCRRPPFAHSRMSPVPRSFLVRCPCSADVAVRAGQAGERITCPACGNGLALPRLRDLEKLPTAGPSAPVVRRWDAARGCVLAGTALAVLAGLAAANTGLVGGRALPPAAPADLVRATVVSAADTDVYQAWRAVRRAGVGRLATDDEVRRQLLARSTGALSVVLWTIAAGGVVLAIGGGIGLVRGTSRQPERRP